MARRPGPSAHTVLGATLGLALAAACAPARAPTPAHGTLHGGRFTYPLTAEPTTLNFVTATDQPSVLITRLIGDGLVDHDTRLATVPRLAERWDWSGDGRVLTFHLRSGVRFHDGSPLTSADVLHTYERIIDPRSRAVGRLDPFLPVERVEAPDPLTVRVIYRSPYAPALAAWEVPVLPRHLDTPNAAGASPIDRAPVGSGPFRLAGWEPARRIVLAANENYWGGRPSLDTIDFEIIPSQDTALQALLSGEVDYARLSPLQWEARAVDAEFARRFQRIRFVPFFVYYIAWRGDGSNPYFSDPTVRRAMSLALDREGYVRSVLRGLGEVISSPLRSGSLGADPEPEPIPHDLAGAAALLDRAGWHIEPRTGARARAGIPFRFTLSIFGAGEDSAQFAQVAQENLRQLGIDMSIERLDWPSLLSRLRSGRFQAALSGVLAGADPDWLYGLVHSSQIAGGQNYAAFRSRTVDEWLEEGRRSLSPAVRATAYRNIQRVLREEQPYTYLFCPVSQWALSRRFEPPEPSPYGILDPYPGPIRLHLAAGTRP
jgi:peptide/nickel transport system substrate-binding protein